MLNAGKQFISQFLPNYCDSQKWSRNILSVSSEELSQELLPLVQILEENWNNASISNRRSLGSISCFSKRRRQECWHLPNATNMLVYSSRKLIIMTSSYKLGGSNYFCATDTTGVGLDVIYAILPIHTANTQNSKRATNVTLLRNFLAANAQNNKHSFVQPYFQ
jgi:hypothetical protein